MTTPELHDFRDLLAGSDPFRGLQGADLDTVLGASLLLEFDAGETVVDEGLPGPGLFVVLQGAVECFLPAVQGDITRPTRVFFRAERAGESFGEMSLVDGELASATVRASEPTLLCFTPAPEFHRLMEAHDRLGRVVYRNLLAQVTARLREKDRDLDQLGFH